MYPFKIVLANLIIKSLSENPHLWKFTEHNACYKDLKIWIANRPYADLKIGEYNNGGRIGTFFQRRKIRKLMDNIIAERYLEIFK